MKLHALRDGTTVVLREPTMDDVDRMLRFFKDLPMEDQRYLRAQRLDRAQCAKRIQQGLSGRVQRLIVLRKDEVIADGALELTGQDWGRHIGEIRVFVAKPYRRHRLGAHLIKDLFASAQAREVEKVIARMAAPQTEARRAFERLGFRLDATLPDYFRDADGNLHDLMVLSCTLDEVWLELKDFYNEERSG